MAICGRPSLQVLPGEAGGAAAARPATQACFMLSGAPAVSLEFLRAVRARRDPAAAMPDPASPEYADAAVAGGWAAGRLHLPPPERQARTSLLAVGPARYCSPCHRIPCNSMHEGSKAVG